MSFGDGWNKKKELLEVEQKQKRKKKNRENHKEIECIGVDDTERKFRTKMAGEKQNWSDVRLRGESGFRREHFLIRQECPLSVPLFYATPFAT